MPICDAVVVARITLNTRIVAWRLPVSGVAIALVDDDDDDDALVLPSTEYESEGHDTHDASAGLVSLEPDPAEGAGGRTCCGFVRPRHAR